MLVLPSWLASRLPSWLGCGDGDGEAVEVGRWAACHGSRLQGLHA